MTTPASLGTRPETRGGRIVDFSSYRARHQGAPADPPARDASAGFISTALLAREERRLRQEMAYLQRRVSQVEAGLRQVRAEMGSIERSNDGSWYLALALAIQNEPPDDPPDQPEVG